MSGFVQRFGGNNINPSSLAYAAIALAANSTLVWPVVGQQPSGATQFLAAQKLDVTPSGGGFSLSLPDATQVSPGEDILYTNLGASTFTVKDFDGNVIATIATTQQWLIYLRTNTADQGTWGAAQLASTTSSANAAALAGFGLKAITTTLNVDHPNAAKSANYNIATSDRAQLITNTGGSINVTFLASATLTNGFFTLVKNAGSGTITLLPTGADLIDGAASVVLNPTESCIVVADGASALYTVGLGRQLSTAVSASSVSVAGTGTYVLTANEAGSRVVAFTGLLTGNRTAEFGTGSGFWNVRNATTGAFTLACRVNGADAGVFVPQGATVVLQSDGTNMRWAEDDVTTTGIVARVGAPAAGTPYLARTITGTASQITVSNGSGVAGDPTLSLPAALVLPGSLTLNANNVNLTVTPTGTGTIIVNPATIGTLDNVTIGATTRAAASVTTLSTSGAATVRGPLNEGTTGGSANAQTLDLTPDLGALVTGAIVNAFMGFTSTNTAPTLAIDGLAALTLKQPDGTALPFGGELMISTLQRILYDGTNGRLLDLPWKIGTFTPTLISSGGGVPTYTSQNGRYLRLGPLMIYQARIVLLTVGTIAGGSLSVASLPYAAIETSYSIRTDLAVFNFGAYAGPGMGTISQFTSGGTSGLFQITEQGGVVSGASVGLSNTTQIQQMGWYFTAATF